MCNRCANLVNRLPHDRIKAIRATDIYRDSEQHKKDIENFKKLRPKPKGK